ncbi:hypothetical protein AMK85_28455 [Escherichia coli]|nr:hypothetical protein AMK85_28455 [Escherichia coli]
MPNLCIQHDAGCLPVNSAMTRQNPQLAYTIRNQTSVIMPRRPGGFIMQDFFNKRSACQATVDYLNCEAFNISLSGVFPVIKSPQKRVRADKCGVAR